MKLITNKKMIRTLLRSALCMLLILSMAFSESAGSIAMAVENGIYVEDLRICVSDSKKEAQSHFDRIGYTMVEWDLNPDTGTGKYVYLGYRTTTDPDKAVTSIRVMPMQSGYQLYDYSAVLEYMSAISSKTANKLKKAADSFVEKYKAGSPKAKDAMKGLNLFYISSENNELLGNYILEGKADLQFYTDLVLKASSGTVNAISNLLNTGLAPYKNDQDAETGELKTVPWAEMVAKSSLWERYAEGLTTDEKKELAKKFEDPARSLFASIQSFTTFYENALVRYRENGEVYEPSVEIRNNEEYVEKADQITLEDTDILYLAAYEALNGFELDDGTKLGDWFLSIGRCTLETVDLMQLYPVLDAMGEGMVEIATVTGFLSAVLNLGENEQNKEFAEAIEELEGDLGKNGEAYMEVFATLDDEFMGKTFALTSEALRRHGAENGPLSLLERYDKTKANINEKIKNIGFCMSIAGLGVAVLTAVGKVGVAVLLSTATETTTATVLSSTSYAIFSGIAEFGAGLGTAMFWTGIGLLVVSIGVAIVFWIMKKYAEINKSQYQTEKPDYIYDSVDNKGITTNVLYKCALDNDGNVGDINAGKQWKWVVLAFSTDKDGGSPIKADETGNIFKAVRYKPDRQDGYDNVKYFGERDAANLNAYCEDGIPIYLHYSTEESLANRKGTDEPAEPETEITEPEETVTESAETEESSGETAETEEPLTEPAETGESSTEPAETGESSAQPAETGESSTQPAETQPAKTDGQPKSYIRDIVVAIGKSADEARNVIIALKEKHYVLDYNLSPDQDFITYIGYSITDDPKEAITDLRVAPYAAAQRQEVYYGDAMYKQVGILGFYVGKGSEQSTPAGDALYFSRDKGVGSPIAVDSFRVVGAPKEAEAGWEPVSFFGSDVAYNFNTHYEIGNAVIDGSRGSVSYYSTKKDNNLNKERSLYLYYEPTVKYTSGTKYLSGMFFLRGYDTGESVRDDADWEVHEKIAAFAEKVNADPRCTVLTDTNLLQAVKYKYEMGGQSNLVQYLGYSWTYNPKRAVSDLAVFQADAYTTSMPYTMGKATEDISRNYVAAIGLQQAYHYEYKEGILMRFVNPNNAFLAHNASLIKSPEDYVSKGYTTKLPEGISFGYKKTPILSAGLYVSGPVEGLDPLKLEDVIVTNSTEASYTIKETKVMWQVSGKTLAGTAPDGKKSFRPIMEMKDPNAETVFNMAYPDYTLDYKDIAFEYHWSGKGASMAIFIRGQQQTRKKYISALSVGSLSRQQYKESKPSASSDELKVIDRIANQQAMMDAVSGCTDELIVMNIAADNQNNAWYNKQKDGVGSIDAPAEVPAAYIGVSRTDSPAQAITGVILYKCSDKTAPSMLLVEKVEYICAGVSSPIYSNREKFFLYYTYNAGASPGSPIEDITIDSTPIIDGAATNLCLDKGGNKLYGKGDQKYYIHLFYDHSSVDFINKLYIGRGNNANEAMADLLNQECTEYIGMDLNNRVKGKTIYLGYRAGSYDWSEINELETQEERDEAIVDQQVEAIYDIVVTKDEPFREEGIISKGIYYYPVSDVNLNDGSPFGAELYMYCASPYYSKRYNEKNSVKTDLPQDVFSSYIKRLGFAENERVPYTALLENDADFLSARKKAAENGNEADFLPWEYVMQSGDVCPADLNDGAIRCNGDYCEDTRLHMFAQREDCSVKPAGQITGGFVESTITVGDLYIRK